MKNNKLLVVFHVDQNNKQLVIKQQVACYKITSSLLFLQQPFDLCSTPYFIVVLPNITHGRIRIRSEIFGMNIAPRYRKNSYILAKFIQDNDMIDMFPGEVQF